MTYQCKIGTKVYVSNEWDRVKNRALYIVDELCQQGYEAHIIPISATAFHIHCRKTGECFVIFVEESEDIEIC